MTVMSDVTARERKGLVEPYHPSMQRVPGQLSHGQSACGYDATITDDLRVFTGPAFGGAWHEPIDPLAFDGEHILRKLEPVLHYRGTTQESVFYLGGLTYALACTHEVFNVPKNHVGLVIGKSTLARCGLIINATPLEPGWRGQITLELFNATPRRMILRPFQAICQVLFLEIDRVPDQIYDSSRKYQDQSGIVLPVAEGGRQSPPPVITVTQVLSELRSTEVE